MKNLLLLVLAGFFLTGCEKEKIVIIEVEKDYNWKMHPNFTYNQAVQMNSYSIDDYLFLYGLYSLSVIGPNLIGNHPIDTISGAWITNYAHWVNNQHSQYKFPISKNFLIEYETDADFFRKDNKLWFVPTGNPFTGNTTFTFSLKDIDTSFVRYSFPSYTQGVCIAINNNDQALIPYYGVGGYKLALVNVKVNSNSNISLDTLMTKIITLNHFNAYNALKIQSIDKYFFLTTVSKTYRINSAGDITGVYDYRFHDIIEKQDSLFAVGYNNRLQHYEWVCSMDKGISWNTVANIPGEFSWLSYTLINERIIGFRNSQIWEIKRKSTGFEAIELDNSGLDGKMITSITFFKDNIYVSSLSGIFYRNLDSFFDVKEIISK